MKQTANAVWSGSVKEGNGKITTASKSLDKAAYSYASRFENEDNTNPDELLAASHAGCFAMALSLILGKEGFTPDSLDVSATVTMNADELELTESHLDLKAKIPNIDKDKFMECARTAKDNCPISKALSLKITMEATLL